VIIESRPFLLDHQPEEKVVLEVFVPDLGGIELRIPLPDLQNGKTLSVGKEIASDPIPKSAKPGPDTMTVATYYPPIRPAPGLGPKKGSVKLQLGGAGITGELDLTVEALPGNEAAVVMPSNPLRFHVNEISVPLAVYATKDAMDRAMSHVPPATRSSPLRMRSRFDEVTVYDDGEVFIVVDTWAGEILLTTQEERIRAGSRSIWSGGNASPNAITVWYTPPRARGERIAPFDGHLQLAIERLDDKEVLTGEFELFFRSPPGHPVAMPEDPVRIRVPRIYAPIARRSAE
jgi:hypothetical protein